MYTGLVARRLAALALTFVFALVPVATVVCEASCTPHAASAMPGGHRCCHGPSHGKTPAVRAVAMLCDHPADTPPGTGGPQQLAGTPAPLAFAVSPSAPVLDATQLRARLTSPLPLTTTTTQLRI